ncbi:hypothetical protein IAG41_22725 [Sphingomonas sp. JC676]|uniref:hypothetical protein n=1 Tax=Sphingomonas sp. JC676 TaxID=2768065 RepID=UPI0016582A87|nr:hypothetical protein [Sphingomonas sp. JC676]MBC9035215.1 hypothetical protein [Sphingomonas sp. JC676]
MMRKKSILLASALLGPVLIALTVIAAQSSDFRSFVTSEDGGMHGILAIILVGAVVYSTVFQLWLAKKFWEPRIARAFDQIGRR